ncbi:DUF1796 family putative cysteine peptidase [Paenibacillus popilliae]|uniref:Papain-like cysteine peptidase n=1 Tax=Paenibacillus popilliae TaxID=78057 RepID=A0ABY3ALT3_PAEPP|nr:DUF1796 family putative cysteine peptidase [Paenibacillus sp. SDF0028]TQR43694.1 hypothetical protein C7Y44_16260 [Paenibacillus sp. SDF0028]
MKLEDIWGYYNKVIGIGSSCQTAHQLKENKLREFSGPLDWFVMDDLSKLNLLLENKFDDLMSQENIIDEGLHDESHRKIRDIKYDCLSVHDFTVESSWQTQYIQFKEQMNRRVKRFYDEIEKSHSVLFVRAQAYERSEIIRLCKNLSEIQLNYKLLIVNYTVEQRVIDINCDIDNVAMVQIPSPENRWQGSDEAWKYILSGVRLA